MNPLVLVEVAVVEVVSYSPAFAFLYSLNLERILM
jgi:hypothetical protein